jgi:hypothetical protein
MRSSFTKKYFLSALAANSRLLLKKSHLRIRPASVSRSAAYIHHAPDNERIDQGLVFHAAHAT